jgi:hypothetical protein
MYRESFLKERLRLRLRLSKEDRRPGRLKFRSRLSSETPKLLADTFNE